MYLIVDQDTCCQASHNALLKAQPRTAPQSPGGLIKQVDDDDNDGDDDAGDGDDDGGGGG